MRINHNISAINAHRQLSSNQGVTSKSLEKLSSGLRINTAGDDAAGLAISEKMRSQIRGLSKAQSNAQDSISLIQTAEGALQQVSDILQRMRELSVQSMNGILSDTEKASIGSEMTQLRQEVDRIAETSKFNNTYLLKGTLGLAADTNRSSVYEAVGDNFELIDGIKTLDVAASEKNTDYTITVTDGKKYIATASTDANTLESIDGFDPDTNVTVGKASANDIVIGDTIGGKEVVADATAVGADTGTKIALDDAKAQTIAVNDVVGGKTVVADAPAGQVYAAEAGVTVGTRVIAKDVKTLTLSYTGVDGKAKTATKEIDKDEASNYSGFLAFTNSENDADSGIKIQVENMDLANLDGKNVYTSDGGKTKLQIGANSVDTPLEIEIPDLRALALGIEELDVNTTASAKITLDKIDNALTILNSARGNLGAYQNRLEYTLNSLAASEENLTAAESRIRDVDMAKEMMNFTQANILNQSATAMLAQANQQPQTVLQLLQGL